MLEYCSYSASFFFSSRPSIFASGTTTALCDFHYSRHIGYLTLLLCQSQLTTPVPREDHCVRVKFLASIWLSHRTAVAAGGRTAAAEEAKVSCLGFDTDIASHRIASQEVNLKRSRNLRFRQATGGRVRAWSLHGRRGLGGWEG